MKSCRPLRCKMVSTLPCALARVSGPRRRVHRGEALEQRLAPLELLYARSSQRVLAWRERRCKGDQSQSEHRRRVGEGLGSVRLADNIQHTTRAPKTWQKVPSSLPMCLPNSQRSRRLFRGPESYLAHTRSHSTHQSRPSGFFGQALENHQHDPAVLGTRFFSSTAMVRAAATTTPPRVGPSYVCVF